MLKINDKVIQVDRPELGVGVILGITHDPEALYSIDFPFLRCTRRSYQLKLYEKMQEERNITLTLDKAKEWYKKGEELREIALQAFTEKELNPLPRSWEEFCKQGNPVAFWRYNIPIKYEALFKLEQLRNCWWNGWKPEWNNCEKYVIKWDDDDLIVFTARNIHAFLVFPTREMAYEFLKCFRYLIEQARDLI